MDFHTGRPCDSNNQLQQKSAHKLIYYIRVCGDPFSGIGFSILPACLKRPMFLSVAAEIYITTHGLDETYIHGQAAKMNEE